jgi:hypothetical protein
MVTVNGIIDWISNSPFHGARGNETLFVPADVDGNEFLAIPTHVPLLILNNPVYISPLLKQFTYTNLLFVSAIDIVTVFSFAIDE